MYLSKRHLSRRAVLRGTGAAVALPFLDAMVPAGNARAATAVQPGMRMGFVYFAHGAVMDRWTPQGTGSDFAFSDILRPLEKHREQLTVVSNLRNRPAESPSPHGGVEQTWLTAVAPPRVGQDGPDAGVSIDQLAVRHIGQETSFPSLELTSEIKEGGHSYRTPTQRLPMEHNPRSVFYRMFGPGDSLDERAAILDDTGSILDRIQQETAAFRRRLGTEDRARVDEYLDSVREVERQVQNMKDQDFSGLDIPDAPVGVPDALDAYMNLMFDLVALAWQADLTRVFTLRMAAEISMRTYNHIGISEAFHPLSHHSEDPESLARLADIQIYHTEVFARFVDRLAAMREGDGSVLDHSIVLYGSNMSDSDLHNNDPLPSVIVGRGGGRIRGGQHLSYPRDTPHANLLVTLLERGGVPVESVGDSTGLLAEV